MAIYNYSGTAIASASSGSTTNKLSGKTVSFIGDSYSVNLSATAWCDVLCTNAGATLKKWTWSGHRFTSTIVSGGDDGHSMYHQAKHIKESNWNPDIIVIAAGTNDQGSSEEIGSINTTATTVDGFDKTDYVQAMQATIMQLQNDFPNAVILCGWTPANGLHNGSDEYCEAMKAVCIHYGVRYIETRDCGITQNNATMKSTYWFGSSDTYSDHPNQAGHNAIAAAMQKKIEALL